MRRPGGVTSVDCLKIAMTAAIAAVDVLWIVTAGYQFALVSAVRVCIAVAGLLGLAEFYRRWRPNPDFIVMVRETAWLLAFSAAAAVFSNLVITLNLPLVDAQIAAVDRLLHFDWGAYYAYVVARPWLGTVCALLYVAVLPLVGFGIIVLSAIGRTDRASELVLAAMIGVLIATAVSGLWPSAGALAYYRPDESLALHHPVVDLAYKQAFFDLRSGQWTNFSLDDIRGLIAFPSYHATLNVVVVLAFRGIWKFVWPMLALNVAMLATTPVEGGHHLAGTIGGVVVAIVATSLAAWVQRRLAAGVGGSYAAAIAVSQEPIEAPAPAR